MRYLSWALRILLFLLLFGFALKNTNPVTVRFYLGSQWEAPLALVLLVFFGVGAVAGVDGVPEPCLPAASRNPPLAQRVRGKVDCAGTPLPKSSPVHWSCATQCASSERAAQRCLQTRLGRLTWTMEFELWWLLGISAVLRARLDGGAGGHQATAVRIARAARFRTSRASISCSTSSRTRRSKPSSRS